MCRLASLNISTAISQEKSCCVTQPSACCCHGLTGPTLQQQPFWRFTQIVKESAIQPSPTLLEPTMSLMAEKQPSKQKNHIIFLRLPFQASERERETVWKGGKRAGLLLKAEIKEDTGGKVSVLGQPSIFFCCIFGFFKIWFVVETVIQIAVPHVTF